MCAKAEYFRPVRKIVRIIAWVRVEMQTAQWLCVCVFVTLVYAVEMRCIAGDMRSIPSCSRLLPSSQAGIKGER